MSHNFLQISEKFFSIQGEGKTIGAPSIFIRLSGCNLLCKSDSWTCDSIDVWKKGTRTEFKDILSTEDIIGLKNGIHLIFTGGEPLLHQKNIASFLSFLNTEYNLRPFVEVETNGTILPIKDLIFDVNVWNVSPKLSNSGESKEKRFNRAAIFRLNKLNTIFKFVIDKREDVEEIFSDFGNIIAHNKVYLMPAADNQEDLSKKRREVIEFCKQYILNFTDRLHITTWNKKTGV